MDVPAAPGKSLDVPMTPATLKKTLLGCGPGSPPASPIAPAKTPFPSKPTSNRGGLKTKVLKPRWLGPVAMKSVSSVDIGSSFVCKGARLSRAYKNAKSHCCCPDTKRQRLLLN